jgi:hypothetical protein
VDVFHVLLAVGGLGQHGAVEGDVRCQREGPAGPLADAGVRRGRLPDVEQPCRAALRLAHVRVTVALAAAAADVADALTIGWDAFQDAAGDDLAGWEVTAAMAEIQPALVNPS